MINFMVSYFYNTPFFCSKSFKYTGQYIVLSFCYMNLDAWVTVVVNDNFR